MLTESIGLVPPVKADSRAGALGGVGLQTAAGVVGVFTNVFQARQKEALYWDVFVALLENTALQDVADFR